MVKGGDKVARGRIPELGSLVFACRQDPSTVRTKRRSVNPILVSKGGEQLARGRIPEFGGIVRTRRQDSGAVGTNHRIGNPILMDKRAD